jgi:hypothetical protein
LYTVTHIRNLSRISLFQYRSDFYFNILVHFSEYRHMIWACLLKMGKKCSHLKWHKRLTSKPDCKPLFCERWLSRGMLIAHLVSASCADFASIGRLWRGSWYCCRQFWQWLPSF